jgi:hypothetical protein
MSGEQNCIDYPTSFALLSFSQPGHPSWKSVPHYTPKAWYAPLPFFLSGVWRRKKIDTSTKKMWRNSDDELDGAGPEKIL